MRALKLWQQARSQAKKLQLPFDLALITLEIGTYQQNMVELTSAIKILERLEAHLEAKKLFRQATKIYALMPFGGAGLKLKVPKRKDFGDEGEQGDAAHVKRLALHPTNSRERPPPRTPPKQVTLPRDYGCRTHSARSKVGMWEGPQTTLFTPTLAPHLAWRASWPRGAQCCKLLSS